METPQAPKGGSRPFLLCRLFATLRASPPLALTWSSVMTDPKTNNRRAEAQRARRLAASLSQPADQDRLKQYAEELERKAAKEDAGHANSRPDRQKHER
jgi:hypothetical protein